tara:strand:+ start:1374 stop:1871 length:498 start_codon:yes stop_codon:yes gene_type:complete
MNLLERREYARIYMSNYRKTSKGLKQNRIQNWKTKKIKIDDYDKLYDKYVSTTHCESCECFLDNPDDKGSRKCLDHDHKTGSVRMICCHRCNISQLDAEMNPHNKSGHRGICYIENRNSYNYIKHNKGIKFTIRSRSLTNCLIAKFAILMLIRSKKAINNISMTL